MFTISTYLHHSMTLVYYFTEPCCTSVAALLGALRVVAKHIVTLGWAQSWHWFETKRKSFSHCRHILHLPPISIALSIALPLCMSHIVYWKFLTLCKFHHLQIIFPYLFSVLWFSIEILRTSMTFSNGKIGWAPVHLTLRPALWRPQAAQQAHLHHNPGALNEELKFIEYIETKRMEFIEFIEFKKI